MLQHWNRKTLWFHQIDLQSDSLPFLKITPINLHSIYIQSVQQFPVKCSWSVSIVGAIHYSNGGGAIVPKTCPSHIVLADKLIKYFSIYSLLRPLFSTILLTDAHTVFCLMSTYDPEMSENFSVITDGKSTMKMYRLDMSLWTRIKWNTQTSYYKIWFSGKIRYLHRTWNDGALFSLNSEPIFAF